MTIGDGGKASEGWCEVAVDQIFKMVIEFAPLHGYYLENGPSLSKMQWSSIV